MMFVGLGNCFKLNKNSSEFCSLCVSNELHKKVVASFSCSTHFPLENALPIAKCRQVVFDNGSVATQPGIETPDNNAKEIRQSF